MKFDLEKNYKRLEEFSSLKDNWNSYGALAILPGSIDNARKTLSKLVDMGLELSPFVYPTVAGDIQLDWDEGRFSLEVEINENSMLIWLSTDIFKDPQCPPPQNIKKRARELDLLDCHVVSIASDYGLYKGCSLLNVLIKGITS